MISSPRNAVAVLFSGAWGDLFISTAALAEAFRLYPQSEGWIVGSKAWLDIIQPDQWPTVTKIVVSQNGFSGDVFERSEKNNPSYTGGHWRLSQKNQNLIPLFSRCQATFNLRTESARYGWAPLFARVPVRYGSAPWPSRFFYTHCSPWLGKDPLIHERDRLLQILGSSQIMHWKSTGGLPRLKIPDPKNAEKWTSSPFKKYWLINPTSSRKDNAWPAENFKKLIEKLEPALRDQGLEIKVIGAPSELSWLEEVATHKRQIVTTPTISDLMDVVAGAVQLVTNTSSIQFIAAGFATPTLTLMGRARPEIWGPLGKSDSILQGHVDPALKHDVSLQEKVAYASIPLQQVLEKCEALITGRTT